MMDMELIRHLPDDAKKRYLELERLFDTPGWNLVVETAKERRMTAVSRQLSAPTWDEVNLCRGAAIAYSDIENLQTEVENLFTNLAEASKTLANDDDELEHE